MPRKLWSVLVVSLLAAGCQEPAHDMMGPPKKPARPAELSKLEPMIGTWSGTAEMIEPSAEEMRKGMPPDAPAPQTTFNGGGTNAWALDGTAMMNQGWHDMGEGQKANYLEIIRWDDKKAKFHSWYWSDFGEQGEGWMTVSDDGRCFTVTASGTGMDGKPMKGNGTMTVIDANTMDWTWTEKGGHGPMKLKGTMKKQG